MEKCRKKRWSGRKPRKGRQEENKINRKSNKVKETNSRMIAKRKKTKKR